MKIEKGKRYVFNATQNTLSKYNGTIVCIVFPLTKFGVDLPLYRAIFFDGRCEDVFANELSEIK